MGTWLHAGEGASATSVGRLACQMAEPKTHDPDQSIRTVPDKQKGRMKCGDGKKDTIEQDQARVKHAQWIASVKAKS